MHFFITQNNVSFRHKLQEDLYEKKDHRRIGYVRTRALDGRLRRKQGGFHTGQYRINAGATHFN